MKKPPRETKFYYYLIGGVPLRPSGAAFVTPIFGRRDTKKIYLQCSVNEYNDKRFIEITSDHGLTNDVYQIAASNRLLLGEDDGDVFGYFEPGSEVQFASASDLADHLIYTRATRRADDAHRRMVKSFIKKHSVDRSASVEIDVQNLHQWLTTKSSKHLIDIALKNKTAVLRLRHKHRSESLFFLTASYLTDPVLNERGLARHLWSRPHQRLAVGKSLSLKSALGIVAKSVEFIVGLLGRNQRVDLDVSRLIAGAMYNSIVPSVYYIKSDFYREFSYGGGARRGKHQAVLYADDRISRNYDDLLRTMTLCSAYRKFDIESTVSLMTRDTAETIYRYLVDLRCYSSDVKFDDIFDDDLDKLESAGLKIKALDATHGNIVRK